MEDVTGLGKIAESKLVNAIYEDTVALAAREIGSAAADVIKTMRLFTAPFQLAALAQDRFKRWLDEVRSRVPLDMQVEAPPSVAGPALRAMLFMEDNDPMVRMFMNLLAQAIHKDLQQGVHPGFVRVLEQINPDEAFLLRKMKDHPMLGAQTLIKIQEGSTALVQSLTTFPQDDFADPDNICMYFEHLESLCLVAHRPDVTIIPPATNPEFKDYRWYALTSFGARFLQVCGQ